MTHVERQQANTSLYAAFCLRHQVLSRANLEGAAAAQVKGNVENILEQKSRVCRTMFDILQHTLFPPSKRVVTVTVFAHKELFTDSAIFVHRSKSKI